MMEGEMMDPGRMHGFAISLLLGSSGGVRPAVVGRQNGTSAGAFADHLWSMVKVLKDSCRPWFNHIVNDVCDLS